MDAAGGVYRSGGNSASPPGPVDLREGRNKHTNNGDKKRKTRRAGTVSLWFPPVQPVRDGRGDSGEGKRPKLRTESGASSRRTGEAGGQNGASSSRQRRRTIPDVRLVDLHNKGPHRYFKVIFLLAEWR